jgi:hypothetical protein
LPYCLIQSTPSSTVFVVEANNDEVAHAFYETQRIIVLFTRVQRRPLSPVRRAWSTSTYPISFRSILMLLPHLCHGLPSGSFHLSYTMKISHEFLTSPTHVTCRSNYVVFNPITLIVSSEQYRQWSSFICSLHTLPPQPKTVPRYHQIWFVPTDDTKVQINVEQV